MLQAAFRDLHGSRLHGFALLVALGDRRMASAATANALSAASPRLAELRHPERAAAWLRNHVVQDVRAAGRTPVPEAERRAALRGLGVAEPAFDGLAALSTLERAALVSASVERLDALDVERVVGRTQADTSRLLERARKGYLAAAMAREGSPRTDPNAPADLAARVEAVAARTMGSGWAAR